MSKPKYKDGAIVHTVGEFEILSKYRSWFRVRFGNRTKTMHVSFLKSWQYHLLEKFISHGYVRIAERIEDSNG